MIKIGGGGVKCGVNIVSPAYINQYEYDLILICSIYEEDIERQLVKELGVSKKKIETRRHFFDNVIFPWYERRFRDKKILVMGEKYKFDILYQLYYKFFNIVGFITLEDISSAVSYEYDYVLLTHYERECEVMDKAADSGYIQKEHLLSDRLFAVYRNHIEQSSNGEKYPDKKFFVICFGGCGAGLGAICRIVIDNVHYAEQNGYIPIIDMKSYKTQYIEESEFGGINAWEKFFLQPTKYTLEDTESAKFILTVYTEIRWAPLYRSNSSYFPQMQNNLLEKYKKFLNKFISKRVLGVLFRGTDYAQQKPKGLYRQPDLDSVISMTHKKMKEWGGFDLIFLCTEVQQACDRFEIEFGDKVFYYPQLRFDAQQNIVRLALYSFGIQEERTKRGEDYWIALNVLASCSSIIAGRCSGTDMVLKMNNNRYENIYLFDLGRYGIDE